MNWRKKGEQADGGAEPVDMTDMGLLLLLFTIAALVAAFMAHGEGVYAAVGIAIEIFLASFISGAVLGFIFAVPRVLSQGNTGSAEAPTRTASRFLQSNTNLERISDWLTTMLVGVGLSQLHRVNDALLAFRTYIAETATVVGGTAGALPAIAPAILVFGVLSGFLFMYLHTRIDLVRLFNEVEGMLDGEARRAVVGLARSTESSSSSKVADIAGSDSVSVDDAIDLMFDLLYQPGGYQQVIRLAEELSNSPATKRAEYWFYLAAALGQAHAAAKRAGDSEAAQSARDRAIEAAQRAVRLDASYRARLRRISDPNSTDNDLSTLRDDPEFVALVNGERAKR